MRVGGRVTLYMVPHETQHWFAEEDETAEEEDLGTKYVAAREGSAFKVRRRVKAFTGDAHLLSDH